MGYPRFYRAVEAMIPDIALDTKVARNVVRKAGLRVGGAVVRAINVYWYPPPELTTPPLPYNTGGTPARRVHEPTGLDWYSGSKFLAPGATPSAASRIMPPGVTWWRSQSSMGWRNNNSWRWNWFNPGGYCWDSSGTSRPNGRMALMEMPEPEYFSYSQRPFHPPIPPGYPGWPASNYVGMPWVTGRTMYDPFPYPDAPLYFWADLANVKRLGYYIFGVSWGFGPGPGLGSSVNDTAIPREYTNNIDKAILFRLWYSDDMGATWKPPFFATGNDDLESGSQGHSGTWTNHYPENGTMWVNAFSVSGNQTTYRVLNSTIHPGLLGSAYSFFPLRPEVRKDNLLFKITLETPRTDTWVQFRFCGIGFGIESNEWSGRGTPGY